MATRASARLNLLSPPPQLAPATSTTSTSTSTKMTNTKIPVSSVEWSQIQLEEYKVHITASSEPSSLIPVTFTSHRKTSPSFIPTYCAKTIDSPVTPDQLVVETAVTSTTEGDYLIHAFLDTLSMTQNIMSGDEQRKSIPGLEGYTKQLLSDFVRIMFLANKSTLGKCGMGQVQIRYFLQNKIWWLTWVKSIWSNVI
jgi:hypothetical protein